MNEQILDANDLPEAVRPGNAPERFQVMLRLDKGLPQSSVEALARSQGGRLEKTVIAEDSPLAGGKGSVIVLSFPDTPARDNIIQALSRRPGVEIAELDVSQNALMASSDAHYGNGNLWGMYGPSGDGVGAYSNAFGTHADVAWARSDVSADNKVGSMRTVVGVIDSGIDPLHPDLYLNVWINQKEIPAGLATDQDSDGVITFRDLNVQVSGNYVNVVSDVNGNGRIDADDILRLPAWANGVDNDSNGFVDDLFGWDFRNNDNRPFESRDGTGTNGNPADSYHGTHVSGTIGALANGVGVVGVAWNVQILPMRFLGSDGTGNTSDAISALYYYTALAQANPSLEFVGTNNSWGGGGPSSLLANAIQTAGNNGHLFVAAAGNNGTNNEIVHNYPSDYAIASTFQGVAYDPVISVASITNTGSRSSFSNYGAISVDIAAPGSTIASTLAGNEWTGSYTYANLNGTSMATPHVTGAAVLIASEYPGLHPADLKSAILGGRTAYSSMTGLVSSGGRLNIPGSISLVGPSPVIGLSDTLLNLGVSSATVTITFPEAVSGFDLADLSVSPGHGSVSGLTTSNNIVWTATFTPANVETQAAKILVGNRFTTTFGDFGREGESALFAIDRVAPAATVNSIVATRDGAGANVDGTLNAGLGSGEVLNVYRGSTLLGNASVTGTSWHFDDTTALSDGTYQYTARAVDAAGNSGPLSGNGTLVIGSSLPAPSVVVNDALLNLADVSAGVTITFSEAVTGFDLADLSVSPGHGSLSGLTTSNNIVWTATFTPANVETQAAKVVVGTGYTSQVGGKSATAGESALFAIDRVAPAATVNSIVATRDGAGANVDGTLNAGLGSGEVLNVYRGSTLLGNASVTGTSWHFDDTTALSDGTYQYTARAVDAAGNSGPLSGNGTLVIGSSLPAPSVVVNDALLNLADVSAGVTITFSEAVTGFDLADLSVSPGHGSLSGLTTSNNIVWTATFTPANVETQAAKVVVGTGYTSQVGGKSATAGESALFAIDRVAPAATVNSIVATRDGAGANVDGTLNAGLGSGEVLNVYRGSTLLGNASVTGTSWHFDDTTALSDGTYQYTARAVDAAGNSGFWSGQGTLVTSTPTADFSLSLGVTRGGPYGRGYNGTNDADGRVTASFSGTSQNLLLSLTGYDVDTTTEMRVLLNGVQFGYLAPTANNSTGLSELVIPASFQQVGSNFLTFENANAANIWGISNILLSSAATAQMALTPGVTLGGSFGRGFNGTNDADGRVTAAFSGTEQNLRLRLTGYDIDTTTEMRVLLNGEQIGFLTPTGDSRTGTSELTIPASEQLDGANFISFVNINAANIWGVTNIRIDTIV